MRSTLQLLKSAVCLAFIIFSIGKSFGQAGPLDESFGNVGQVFDTSINISASPKIGLQKNGKIILGYPVGNDLLGSSYTIVFKRFNTNGIIDSSFGNNGTKKLKQNYSGSTGVGVFCIAIDLNDRIIFGLIAEKKTSDPYITNHDFLIKRLTKNGRVDSSFGVNGSTIIDFTNNPSYIGHDSYPSSIAVNQEGKILITGSYMPTTNPEGDNFCIPLAKLKTDGSPDSSFGTNGKVLIPLMLEKMYPNHLLIQPDGKIVLGEYLMRQSAIKPFNWGVYRFNPNGSLDQSFGDSGRVVTNFPGNYAILRGLALMNDKIIACGDGYSKNNTYNQMLEKYEENGSINKSFERNARTSETHSLSYIKVSPGSKIIALDAYQNLIKFKKNGTPDSSFGTNGIANIYFDSNYQSADMLLQQDDKIVILRSGPSADGSKQVILLERYNNDDAKVFLSDLSSEAIKQQLALPKLYPNPAHNFIYITGLKGGVSTQLSVTDINGKVLAVANTTLPQYKLGIQSLKAGLYYIAVIQNDKTTKRIFLKQ